MTSFWSAAGQSVQFPINLKLDALLYGDTPVMQALKRSIAVIAPSDVPVLVTGPTGAGKEVVANALHLMSERSGPLVPVNCGAIPDDLLESELFGHEKGAFTGAQARRIGLIEQAEGGTLFLDEIGETPPHVQVKLLRALETQTIQRVGGGTPIPVDFRLVSATHRDLHADADAGRFRRDLLYRIEVFGLAVPALREHPEDIPMILRAMERAGRGAQPLQLAPDALALLGAHDWPGNVRELRNFHDRAQVLFRGRTITAEDVRGALIPTLGLRKPDPSPTLGAVTAELSEGGPDVKQMMTETGSVDLRGMLQRVEERLILTALELSEGRVTQAARMLRLKRTTLIGRMQKLGLDAGAA
ncbi:sigma-54 interaction domain-containing protein [Roseovarius aquimarinus]|uniref:Sigma-54 interaction domain-containing protein n=1 Tax=Roseovarius aquimarinus TaxID=1229156 RepID=A0ABW7I5S2_9RHOB